MSKHFGSRLKVFLCYASDDKAVAFSLYRSLSNEGVDVWFDEEKLLPGQDWDFEISNAIRGSHAVIVCLTKNSVSKEGYVQKEIKRALDFADEKPEEAIFVIPIKFDNCDIPRRLAHLHFVNMHYPNGYYKLLSALAKRSSSLKLDWPSENSRREYEGASKYTNARYEYPDISISDIQEFLDVHYSDYERDLEGTIKLKNDLDSFSLDLNDLLENEKKISKEISSFLRTYAAIENDENYSWTQYGVVRMTLCITNTEYWNSWRMYASDSIASLINTYRSKLGISS